MTGKRKILITMVSGLIYWMIHYILIKLDLPWFAEILPIILYAILPLTFGFALIAVIRGSAFKSIFYCPLIILVYYSIELVLNYMLIPESLEPLEMVWDSFRFVGMVLILLSVFGGTISVITNRIISKNSVI
jgi:hypothetical protein